MIGYKVSSKISAKGRGLLAALKRVAAHNSSQGVGWFRDQIHPGGLKPTAEIARFVNDGGVNEGGARVPPRPFMTIAVAKNAGKWKAAFSRLVSREMNKGAAADMDGVLWKVGEIVKEDVVEEIDLLTQPPLARYTIEKRKARYVSEGKSFDRASLEKPLIDTGAMVGSIQNRRIG